MERKEKILEAIKNLDKIIEKHKINKTEKTMNLSFVIEGKPVPYARARYTRFGSKGKKGKGRFYNPRQKEMDHYNREFRKQINSDDEEKINNLINNLDAIYYVKLYCKFYVPIQKTETIEKSALKEAGILKPTIRNGDSDNYEKFVQDALHGVIYADDKVVTFISSEKLYSLKPRTEIYAEINIIKE